MQRTALCFDSATLMTSACDDSSTAWLCHHSEVGAGVGFVLLVFWEIRVSRPGELAGAAVRLAMSAVVPCEVRAVLG